MAVLTWDDAGERLYETGTKKGVLYPYNSATKAYDSAAAWNGLTGVTQSPSGAEATAIYANDDKYLTLYSVEELGLTITAYTYPDEFMACDGSKTVVEGLTVGQQSRSQFGLSYVTTLGNDTVGNDYGYIIHLVYGCKASPSERAYATINDSPEAIEFSWEVTTTPVSMTGYFKTALLDVNSTKIDADKLKSLEDVLYGTASEEAKLPLPDEVAALLKGTTA